MKYIIIILVFFIVSCNKDSSNEKITSDINIEMREKIDSTSRTFQFICKTQEEYPCCNYQIGNSFIKNSDRVEINFDGIIKPEVCLTAIGPATTTLDFGAISNGTYDLEINTEGKKSTGQLIITSDYYKIDLDKERKIQINYSTLQKIPTNTIWGTVGYQTNTNATVVQTFLDSLQLLGATNQTYPSGMYAYFQINSAGNILPPENHGYDHIKPYIFHYTGITSNLKTIVKEYGKNYGDSLNIVLYTTNGETFRSWIP